MFGFEVATARTNERPEAAALVEVLKALSWNPAVALAKPQNTGASQGKGRFMLKSARRLSTI